MKKWIALVLVFGCVFCLAQCTGEKAQVSEWARGLSREDIDIAKPWHQRETLEPLNEEEMQKLVTLLNKLTTFSFTETKPWREAHRNTVFRSTLHRKPTI